MTGRKLKLAVCKDEENSEEGTFCPKVLLGEDIHTRHLWSPKPNLLALGEKVSTMFKGPVTLKIQDPERSTLPQLSDNQLIESK